MDPKARFLPRINMLWITRDTCTKIVTFLPKVKWLQAEKSLQCEYNLKTLAMSNKWKECTLFLFYWSLICFCFTNKIGSLGGTEGVKRAIISWCQCQLCSLLRLKNITILKTKGLKPAGRMRPAKSVSAVRVSLKIQKVHFN